MARKKKKKKEEEPTPETKMGFSTDETSESAQAEGLKSHFSDSETLHYDDKDLSTSGIDTYDSTSGAKEGEIILGEKGATGKLIPLEIIEKVENHYEFNAETDIEADRKTSGLFKISNPSDTNKIWDIDVVFDKNKPISLENEIHILNLDPNDTKDFEYEIEQFEEPALKISEFISTLDREETLSYSLSTADKNMVLFKLTVKNLMDFPLKDVFIKKEIQSGYSDVNVLNVSNGTTETNSEFIEWKLETLEANAEAELKLNMSIEIEDASSKIRSGKVTAEYKADKAITGIDINKFDAYSDNFVGVLESQQDDNPDAYDCAVWFQNESDFQMELVNLDVKNADTQVKVLDIDPKEIPTIAAGATWKSVPWVSETDTGEEPRFFKTVEFFLISSKKISTFGTISIDDFELAVAAIAGKLNYSASSITSYRVVPFDALLQVKNVGGADLDEVILEETIQLGYIPPKPEEVELYIVREHESDFEGEDIDWENLGDLIEIDKDLIEITPNDQEPESEHVIRIKLTELKDHPMGMFLPNMVIRLKYPIQAYKPARDSEFVSNVRYTVNTYPAGAAIEVIPPEIRIPVIHLRRKILKGKKVHAMPTEGEYQIILTVKNVGNSSIENVEVRDVIPENFEYGNYSLEPTTFDNLEGKDLLIWKIDRIEANDTYEITYTITGTGEYKAKDSQFSV